MHTGLYYFTGFVFLSWSNCAGIRLAVGGVVNFCGAGARSPCCLVAFPGELDREGLLSEFCGRSHIQVIVIA